MKDIEAHNKVYKDTVLNLYSAMPDMTQKDIEIMSYVSQKTERIAGTSMRIAALIGHNSVVSKDIEQTALLLVRDAARMARDARARSRLLDSMLELTSVLAVAATCGSVAQSNVAILLDEVRALANVVQQYELGSVRTLSTMTGTVLASPTVRADQRTSVIATQSKSHAIDTGDTPVQNAERASQETRPIEEGQQVRNGMQHYRERVQENQKDRRATILGLLQKKDRVTVRDVAAVIKDCSEKTIQRELLALVAQGVLKKEGERRWSSYVLV
jgi:hypothetical protein